MGAGKDLRSSFEKPTIQQRLRIHLVLGAESCTATQEQAQAPVSSVQRARGGPLPRLELKLRLQGTGNRADKQGREQASSGKCCPWLAGRNRPQRKLEATTGLRSGHPTDASRRL